VLTVQNLIQAMDPHLQNAWGVANSPGGPLWIANNSYRLFTLCDCNGVKQGLTTTIPMPADRAALPAAAPAGMVRMAHRGLPDHGGLDDRPGDQHFRYGGWNDCGLELGRRSDRRRGSTGEPGRQFSKGAVSASPSVSINQHGNFPD
jgi:hypothetical protein